MAGQYGPFSDPQNLHAFIDSLSCLSHVLQAVVFVFATLRLRLFLFLFTVLDVTVGLLLERKRQILLDCFQVIFCDCPDALFSGCRNQSVCLSASLQGIWVERSGAARGDPDVTAPVPISAVQRRSLPTASLLR